ncbi:MAG: DsrE family protein [Acidobacteriota bacterium]|nr:MAG: DsrE family protein [Acidobacteriota bacterium]
MPARQIDPSSLILLTSDGMGRGPDELRRKLLSTFLQLLDENGMRPGAICFYTDAVKLALEGSPVLEQLRRLESEGVRLILCKTCLDYFGVAEQVAVGVVGGMGDIISAMALAEKVITL